MSGSMEFKSLVRIMDYERNIFVGMLWKFQGVSIAQDAVPTDDGFYRAFKASQPEINLQFAYQVVKKQTMIRRFEFDCNGTARSSTPLIRTAIKKEVRY